MMCRCQVRIGKGVVGSSDLCVCVCVVGRSSTLLDIQNRVKRETVREGERGKKKTKTKVKKI